MTPYIYDYSGHDQTIELACEYGNGAPLVSVLLAIDHDHTIEFVTIHDAEGVDLDKTLPGAMLDVMWARLRKDFDILRWLDDYLKTSDTCLGRLYMSRREPDWDAMAKQQRIDAEEGLR